MATATAIHTEADYDAALARVTKLIDDLSSPNGQIDDVNHPSRIELDALVTLIEAYEDRHYPIDQPKPVAAIEPWLSKPAILQGK